ncbi:uncharacterized protein RCO7_00062 [Rhynchosporium graminicola]|uniref:Uncharacterized protein n=1 Tax=Rhynchosporium graminicola TaxID=2792576 RepID=A0A1E1KI86_9HELO|nr:uncharacterized protein RCO7_00062 [Rhynchosporium commune]
MSQHHSPAVHSQASQYDNRPTTQHQKKSPVQDITPPTPRDVFIAVMGVTGSRITTFIQQFCQKNLGIGYDLESYVRVGGQGMKDLRVFRKVCGEKKLGSVYLSTRSWEESGEEILDYLLTQSWKVTLDIQHEMVDEGKKLVVETNVGRELQAEIEKIKEAHKKEMLEIREDMEEAIKTQDTERQEELRR